VRQEILPAVVELDARFGIGMERYPAGAQDFVWVGVEGFSVDHPEKYNIGNRE